MPKDLPSEPSNGNSSQKKDKFGVTSRRTFLKSAGLASAGVALLEQTAAGQAAQRSNVQGPGKVQLKLRINGQVQGVSVEPRTTLADALRDELHMTGTKVVCDRGACSACTVMLDNMPVCSCMTLAVDVGNRNVTTVEGLAKGNNLHPVQAAFVAHDALQCGFCTSGMVMSCAALLNKNPNPSPADVRTAISGNICRCGTYPKVMEAALAASRSKGA
jgi:xanthine dehydrogenase YagT iron-sulfur-binding subunit